MTGQNFISEAKLLQVPQRCFHAIIFEVQKDWPGISHLTSEGKWTQATKPVWEESNVSFAVMACVSAYSEGCNSFCVLQRRSSDLKVKGPHRVKALWYWICHLSVFRIQRSLRSVRTSHTWMNWKCSDQYTIDYIITLLLFPEIKYLVPLWSVVD